MAKTRKKITKTTKSHKKNARQHPSHFLKVYWPYIPVIALVVASMIFGGVNPRSSQRSSPATLAYATEMSASALLASTNAQRASNGLSALSINSKLSSSAQSKANDMVSRDYWSHNSPDGQEPWVFFDAAGYNYQKAGENLAYGFSTSDATVIGWMNSPSHRANMLDTTYTEVGFGFTNSSNFVGTGQETIVVAHYAQPVAVAAPVPPAPEPTPTPEPTQPAAQPQSLPANTQSEQKTPAPATVEEQAAPADVESAPEETVADTEVTQKEDTLVNQPVTSETPVPENVPSKNITRLQWLTGGKAPWSALLLSTIAFIIVIVWLIKHAILVKRFLLKGEHFVAHHPILDLVVVMVAAVAVYLSQSSGVVL